MRAVRALEKAARPWHTLRPLRTLCLWHLLALTGCAARVASPARIEVPRDCIISVALTPKTRCDGKDDQHLNCTGIDMRKRKDCEQVHVGR